MIGKTHFDTITPIGLAFRDEKAPVPHVLDTNPALPPGIQAVIEKALARDRSQRYATGMEFAGALTAALSEPAAPPAPAAPLQEEPQPSTSPWLIPGIVILGLILLGLAWKYSNRNESTPPIATSLTVTPTIAPSSTPIPPTPTLTETVTPAPPTRIPLLSLGGADKIAFTANQEISLMNVDGTSLESLTHTNAAKFDLQWLPGGKELLYVEGKCVYSIAVETVEKDPQQLTCFKDDKFLGFRVSPDGQRVAISIANRLIVLPFDLKTLTTAPSACELQKLDSLCLDYAEVTVNGALWCADGRRLAIRYQSVVNGRVGDTIRVIEGNWARCQKDENIQLALRPVGL